MVTKGIFRVPLSRAAWFVRMNDQMKSNKKRQRETASGDSGLLSGIRFSGNRFSGIRLPAVRRTALRLCAAFLSVMTLSLGTGTGRTADTETGQGLLFPGTVEAQAASEPYMKITVIDYGSGRTVYGDATLLESGGKYLLIDTGAMDPYNTVVNYLKRKGIRRLSLYISHFHEDHCYYADKIIKDSWFKVQKLYVGNPDPLKRYVNSRTKKSRRRLFEDCKKGVDFFNSITTAAYKKKIPVVHLRKGKTFTVGSVSAKVLSDHNPRGVSAFDPYDLKGTGYANNNSLVTKFTFRKRSFLTAGDIESSTERDLLASGVNLSADIYKLNHHGVWSSNTEAFLKAVNPCYVYYSYKNTADSEYRRFGSARDVASNLKKLSSKYNILGNRYNGTITYKVQYNTIQVTAARHFKKKVITVRSTSNGKTRKQTLVYNDAQALHLDQRMLFSGTVLASGKAPDPTKVYSGWKKDSVGWKYRTSNGKWLSGGWKTIGGKVYYFNAKGYRQEGWLKLGGKTYFLSRIGIRQLKWQMIDGKVYYFKKDGTMAVGKTWIGGKVWPLRADGSLDLSKMDAPNINILTSENRHTTKK